MTDIITQYPSTLENPILGDDGKNKPSASWKGQRLAPNVDSIDPSVTLEEKEEGLLINNEIPRMREVILQYHEVLPDPALYKDEQLVAVDGDIYKKNGAIGAGTWDRQESTDNEELRNQVTSLSETVNSLVKDLERASYREVYNSDELPSHDQHSSQGAPHPSVSIIGSFNSGEVRSVDFYTGSLDSDHEILDRIIYRKAQGLAAVLRIRLDVAVEFAKQVINLTTSGAITNMGYWLVRNRGGVKTYLSTTPGSQEPVALYAFSASLAKWNSIVCGGSNVANCPAVGTYRAATEFNHSIDVTIDFNPVDLRPGDILEFETRGNGFDGNASIRSTLSQTGATPIFHMAAV